MLKNSANVNATDKRGFTPLHMAARQGHQLVLCTLLDAGARWNARAHQEGITPLHCATISGFSVCFSRFVSTVSFLIVLDNPNSYVGHLIKSRLIPFIRM